MRAKGNDAGTGKSGDINHHFRIKFTCIGEGITQNQTAFSIGIQNFNGNARHAGDDITGFGGSAAGHVFTGWDDTDDIDVELQLGTSG